MSSLQRVCQGLLLLLCMAPAVSSAIVGGVTAAAGDVPGQVALVDLSRTDQQECLASGAGEYFCKQYCGGVLIAPRWVLTAAHCVDEKITSVSSLKVIAGTNDLSAPAVENVIGVAEKYLQPGYAQGSYEADIALLKLDANVSFPLASLVEPAAETAFISSASSLNDELTLSGWGRLSSTGDFPQRLQRVAVDLQTTAVCEAAYNLGLIMNFFPDSMLCAAEYEASDIENDDAGDLGPRDTDGEDVCTYDSGGPAIFLGNGFRQVAGVTSFGVKGVCGSPSYPSVFTRVSSFISWIEDRGKAGGDNFGDLSLVVTGASTAAPGTPVDVAVTLRNASVTTVLPAGVGFDVSVPADVQLSMVSATSLLCTPVTNGLHCVTTGTLNPSVQRVATLRVTPLSSDNLDVDFSARVYVTGLVDYRSGNDERHHRLLFSALPDVALELSGYTQEIVGAHGRAWVIGRVLNRSTSVAANDVQLALTLSSSLTVEEWSVAACATDEVCNLGTLAPGEVREFRVRLHGQDAVDGTAGIVVSQTGGEFPTEVAGQSDTQGEVAIHFNAVPGPGEPSVPTSPTSPPKSSGGGSGGGAASAFLLGVLLLLRIRRRS